MKLWSDAFEDGAYIPAQYASGAIGVEGFSDNYNPPLAWDNVPEGTQSFVLVCRDPDAPAVMDDVNKEDRNIPKETPRQIFYHWLLVDLPAHLRSIAKGEYSQGFVMKGKADAAAAHGTRQGVNDYTAWSKDDPSMAGLYFGYDGPYPPFNDMIPHRYIFTLYALSVKTLNVTGNFVGADVEKALNALQAQGKILGQASMTGLYTMNSQLAKQQSK